MEDFREKMGRTSSYRVPSILKTVSVSREVKLIDLFKRGEFVP